MRRGNRRRNQPKVRRLNLLIGNNSIIYFNIRMRKGLHKEWSRLKKSNMSGNKIPAQVKREALVSFLIMGITKKDAFK